MGAKHDKFDKELRFTPRRRSPRWRPPTPAASPTPPCALYLPGETNG